MTPSAAEYFNDNWKKYQLTIKCNTLYHHEVNEVLNAFLNEHMNGKSFSFVDLGCGDCSTIVSVLRNRKLESYIGIDAAPAVLELAKENMHSVPCHQEFIPLDMLSALSHINKKVDIIFTSYAVHHLSHQQKKELIQKSHDKLNQGGYLIMVDGILKPNQTREEWLSELENRMKITQSLSAEELQFRMQHPRDSDFPEEIATFKNIACEQQWKGFETIFVKDIFACMVFAL